MIVVVSGASGLVGAALVPSLRGVGHRVRRLVRPGGKAAPDDIPWDPARGRLEASALSGCDAVVHLAGENIAARRWSDEQRKRLHDSRVGPTALLARALAEAPRPPRVLVQASATGYYGDRGDELLTESSPPGRGFLPSLCVAWEQASAPAAAAGIRVVHVRFGIVLSARGGALRKMLTPFRLGIGGPVGSGRQFWPWIEIEDAVWIVARALEDESLRGPLNAVSPHTVTCREFTSALGHALRRPAVIPLPAFALRLALGDMATLLLESVRAVPERLVQAGYRFRHPDPDDALRHALML
ncbi:MAG TPA: TIGR01777 family oxidoreductase [Candidatus Polarisedimenticolia bacterium]|nr:TIGR01777 family oxidoreductase [Candidatus Polarisedimenticolia bacterium]